MFAFMQCVAEAIRAKGMRGLLGLVPYGEQIYEVSADAIKRYKERKRLDKIKDDLEELVRADLKEIREEAAKIAKKVAQDRPIEEQAQLELYLVQIPAIARQSLRRPDDPTGTTVSLALHLDDPHQLASVLPQRPPKFRTGDKVPLAPQWAFEQMLGSGGFGEVWLAQHTFFKSRRRAYKFCLDAEARDRLLRHEGEMVRRVMEVSQSVRADADGIVILEEVNFDDDTPWLAYKYIDGGDLTGLIKQWQDFPRPERGMKAIEMLQRLAHVVGELHRLPEPIIHRDLKPANILLQLHGGREILRITDFGISHVAAERAIHQANASTPNGSLGVTFRGAHTPIYASPQQKRGKKADVRDDVFALAIIGYQMILGDVAAERPVGRWRKGVAEYQLPGELWDLLESAWDDEPGERPGDAREIAERLAEIARKLENLKRWQASPNPRTWVEGHLDGWTYEQLHKLVENAKASTYWPLDETELELSLESTRLELVAERELQRLQADKEQKEQEAQALRILAEQEELRLRAEEERREQVELLSAERERQRLHEENERLRLSQLGRSLWCRFPPPVEHQQAAKGLWIEGREAMAADAAIPKSENPLLVKEYARMKPLHIEGQAPLVITPKPIVGKLSDRSEDDYCVPELPPTTPLAAWVEEHGLPPSQAAACRLLAAYGLRLATRDQLVHAIAAKIIVASRVPVWIRDEPYRMFLPGGKIGFPSGTKAIDVRNGLIGVVEMKSI